MAVFLLHANEPGIEWLLDGLQIGHGTELPAGFTEGTVIYWGRFHSEHRAFGSLQPVKCLLRALNPKKAAEQLAVHGINAVRRSDEPAPAAVFPYLFRIPVFHLEALAVFQQKRSPLVIAVGERRERDAFEEIGLEMPTYQTNRAMRLAIKTVYALGLDYGVVTVGIRPGGELVVLGVDPTPKLNRRLGALFAGAANRYAAAEARERGRTEPAVLGADPEFLLLSAAGKIVSASRFLERDGEVGCDAIVLPGHRVITPLAELRPRPSAEPRRLAANRSLAWLAGGMPLRGFPLGGHIHFSRVWLNSHLLRALDNYLALPLMLIEGETTRLRRPRYGFLGDFRRQPHGGFEYRTLPSWMVSPKVAVGVFSLARLIADHYRLLTSRPLQEVDMQRHYYAGNKEKAKSDVEALWAELERVPAYKEFAADLEPLKALILRMEPWNELADFRRSWKIPPYDGRDPIVSKIML
jgi:hypothetical protein